MVIGCGLMLGDDLSGSEEVNLSEPKIPTCAQARRLCSAPYENTTLALHYDNCDNPKMYRRDHFSESFHLRMRDR